MKRFLTILTLLLLAAGFSFEVFAVDAFDVSDAERFDAISANGFNALSEVGEEQFAVETAETDDAAASIFLFTRSIKSAALEFLDHEFGIRQIHGQPLPGVLITFLLGAAFGLARKVRSGRTSAQSEQTAEAALLTARLLRMNILYLNPPETIHTISPGPDLFCQRE